MPWLYVTPSQLKVDWKAGPWRVGPGVTAGIRKRVDDKKDWWIRKRNGNEKKIRLRRHWRSEEMSDEETTESRVGQRG